MSRFSQRLFWIRRILCLLGLYCIGFGGALVAKPVRVDGAGDFGYQWRRRIIRGGFSREVNRALGTPIAASYQNVVLAAQAEGDIIALDAQSGKEVARYAHGVGFAAPLSVAKMGMREWVLVTDQRGKLLALDTKLQAKQWELGLGRPARAPILASEGTAYVRTEGGQIFAVRLKDGKLLWRGGRELAPGMSILGHAGLLLAEDTLYTAFDDGVVGAYRAHDGKALWEIRLPLSAAQRFKDVDTTPVLLNDILFVGCYGQGIFGLDTKTGRVQFEHPLKAVMGLVSVPATATHNGVLGAVSAHGVLIGLDAQSLRLRYRAGFGRGAVQQPSYVSGAVVVNAGREGILFFDAYSGRPLQAFSPRDHFDAPVSVRKDKIYAISGAGYVYALAHGAEGRVGRGRSIFQ